MNKLIANDEYQYKGILKGDKLECLNDCVLREYNPETKEYFESGLCFVKGKIYESPMDDHLIDERGLEHEITGDYLQTNFKRI